VSATVSVGSNVTFNWEPACAVALVLVEDNDGFDQWAVAMPSNLYYTQSTGNKIRPPLTYGIGPTGIDGLRVDDAMQLRAGARYNFYIWRILPHNSTATCIDNTGDYCLLTIQSFTR